MNQAERLIRPRALLLDMDGTLTEPLLDFARIRADSGIPPGQPILEAIAGMDEAARIAAMAILEGHEDRAAQESTLNAGANEVLAWARRHRVGTALITRNSRSSVTTVLSRHGLELDCVLTREDGPIKPDPGALLLACKRLGVARHDVWMIGDGVHDIDAAASAGIRSVWISHRKDWRFAAAPWKSVNDLAELLALLMSAGAT